MLPIKKFTNVIISFSLIYFLTASNNFATGMEFKNRKHLLLLQGRPLAILINVSTLGAIPLSLNPNNMVKTIQKNKHMPSDELTRIIIKYLEDNQAQQCHICM